MPAIVFVILAFNIFFFIRRVWGMTLGSRTVRVGIIDSGIAKQQDFNEFLICC